MLVVFSITLCDVASFSAADSITVNRDNSYEYVPAYKKSTASAYIYPQYDFADVGINVSAGTYNFLMQFKPDMPVRKGTYDIMCRIEDLSDVRVSPSNAQLLILYSTTEGFYVKADRVVKKTSAALDSVSSYWQIYFEDVEIASDAYIIRLLFDCTYTSKNAFSYNPSDFIFTSVSEGPDFSVEVEDPNSDNILDAVSNFFSTFFNNLINTILDLIIPGDGYFDDYFSRLNYFFTSKLGMLWAPIDMLIDVFSELSYRGSSNTSIVFPELKFQNYVLIPRTVVDIRTYLAEFDGLQDTIYFVTDTVLIGAVIVLLQNKLKEAFRS